MARSGNPNPLAARQAKKAKQTHGDIESLRAVLWSLIQRLDAHLAENGIDPDTLKAAHCLIQAGGIFLKTIETGEMEARMTALENQMKESAP